MPEKIRTLLDDYADKHKSFESILESKLEGFYHDLSGSLTIELHLQQINLAQK